MKRHLTTVFLAAAIVAGRAHAQTPAGSDVNTAIPIYYQQMFSDLGDGKTAPIRVFSFTVTKGQQVSATLSVSNTAPSTQMGVGIWAPGTTTLANCGWNCGTNSVAYQIVNGGHSTSVTYTASASGIYYVKVDFASLSVNYTLELTTTTMPTSNPNCTGGTLTGQVDYITYSLTLIAAGLPDSASVGGTQLCATCTVKAPGYPQIAEKMETAMGLNVPVALCYDGSGNVNQITLKHP